MRRYRNASEGISVRMKACELAAQVLSGRREADPELVPLAWSLAVFFESYIVSGARATMREFGPKLPQRLRAVK